MKTNIKFLAVVVSLVGLSMSAYLPVLAQGSTPSECAAAKIIRTSDAQNVPVASLCWPLHLVPETGAPDLVEDVSFLGQPILNHPAVHVSGAAQLIRAGERFIPEASLYLSTHVDQESGASQMIRAAGGANVFIPEASLYLGERMPRVAYSVSE